MHLTQYVPTTLQRSSRTLLRPLNSPSSGKPSRISIPDKLTRMILPSLQQWILTQMSHPVPHKTSMAFLPLMTVTLKMELSLSQCHVCPISSQVFFSPCTFYSQKEAFCGNTVKEWVYSISSSWPYSRWYAHWTEYTWQGYVCVSESSGLSKSTDYFLML